MQISPKYRKGNQSKDHIYYPKSMENGICDLTFDLSPVVHHYCRSLLMFFKKTIFLDFITNLFLHSGKRYSFIHGLRETTCLKNKRNEVEKKRMKEYQSSG